MHKGRACVGKAWVLPYEQHYVKQTVLNMEHTHLITDPSMLLNRSLAGKLRIIKSDALRKRFEGASSADEVAELGQEYVNGVKSGTFGEQGWPGSMYGVSKLCEATYTRVLAEQCQSKGISVYACCPG